MLAPAVAARSLAPTVLNRAPPRTAMPLLGAERDNAPIADSRFVAPHIGVNRDDEWRTTRLLSIERCSNSRLPGQHEGRSVSPQIGLPNVSHHRPETHRAGGNDHTGVQIELVVRVPSLEVFTRIEEIAV